MDDEKVDVQEEVVEQEEETTTEEKTEEAEVDAPVAEQPEEETVTIPKSKLKAMQHKAIAYDALKKGNSLPKKEVTNDNTPIADELKLIARGLSDEEIEQAKVISKGKNISLPEATKDPLFVVFQANLKELKRKEAAKLGASKGSGAVEPKEEFKSGLSSDEHKKLWERAIGK